MFSPANLRHGVCIFTLIGVLSAVLGTSANASDYAPWKKVDINDPTMGFGAPKNENVAAFRLTGKMSLPTAKDGSKQIDLVPGDVIDAAFEMPLIAQYSTMRTTLGEDNYIKWALADSHKGELLEMKVKDAKNAALEGTIVYVRPYDLRFTMLAYDPDYGSYGSLGYDEGEESNDLQDNSTYEVPDVPLFRFGPSKPAHHAGSRQNLPVMKLGMPNLTQVINQAFGNYSGSRQVSRLVSSAYSHVYTVNQRGRRSLTYVAYKRVRSGRRYRTIRITRCWRAVKDALISSGLVARDFAVASPDAFMARSELMDEGFRDLLADSRTSFIARNPDLAPKGAVLVYADVVRGRVLRNDSNPGHVEIKTGASGAGGYISITPTPQAAYGFYSRGTRRLLAIMVKDTQ